MEDVKEILDDDRLYDEAASEAFPVYNKSQMISLELPDRTGDVSIQITPFLYIYTHIHTYI